MKWFALVLALSIVSCKNKKKPSVQTDPQIKQAPIVDYGHFPFRTETDTGYFSGVASKKINDKWEEDTTMLAGFLSGLISKKDLLLLDSQTLSHSVFIDQQLKIRTDTLRNDRNMIISVYEFGENKEKQKITLNGTTISEDDLLAIDEGSFRHFSFRGKEYYYFRASVMDGYAGSIHTLRFHVIYQPSAKAPGIFRTCRFDKMLFGDADGDDKLDYLDFDNSDFCTGVPLSDNARIELYSDEGKEILLNKKISKGKCFLLKVRRVIAICRIHLILKRIAGLFLFTIGNSIFIFHTSKQFQVMADKINLY